MLALSPLLLQVIDGVVLGAGACCLLGYAVNLHRRRQLADPLASVTATDRGPTIAQTAAVLLVYYVCGFLLVQSFTRGIPRELVATPGAHGWHLLQSADMLAKAAVSLLALLLLHLQPAYAPTDRSRLTPPAKLAAGALAALIITPVCLVQLNAGSALWKWFRPEDIQPIHPVLVALQQSAWNVGDVPWGTIQLIVAAVVIAPLAEEVFFRGLMLDSIWGLTRRRWVAVIVSGVGFGFIHGQPQDILPLVTLGIALGYLRMRTRSLVPCIVAHILFNARTMTLVLLAPELIDSR